MPGWKAPSALDALAAHSVGRDRIAAIMDSTTAAAQRSAMAKKIGLGRGGRGARRKKSK